MPSPEHNQVVDMLIAFGVKDKIDTPLSEQRIAYEAAGALYPLPEDVEIEPINVGEMNCEWIRPKSAEKSAALLYLHGGGYVIGSIATHRELVARIVSRSKIPALIIDYRLAPENPFPAALDDSIAAYKYLLSSGNSSDKIAIAGDSAGGGLTMATLLKARDSSISLPGCAVCLSPWVDLTMSGETMDLLVDRDPVVSKESLQMMADHYTRGHDPRDPYVSAIFGELTGLPPILIQVGTAEVLLDDARRLEKTLKAAGIDVTLTEYPELIHVFQAFAANSPEAGQATEEICEFLCRFL